MKCVCLLMRLAKKSSNAAIFYILINLIKPGRLSIGVFGAVCRRLQRFLDARNDYVKVPVSLFYKVVNFFNKFGKVKRLIDNPIATIIKQVVVIT